MLGEPLMHLSLALLPGFRTGSSKGHAYAPWASKASGSRQDDQPGMKLSWKPSF